MKKSFSKLSFKKSKISILTSSIVKGGLPTTKQSTVNPPPPMPGSWGCWPDSFSCYPDQCA